jgi:hypothetical protein
MGATSSDSGGEVKDDRRVKVRMPAVSIKAARRAVKQWLVEADRFARDHEPFGQLLFGLGLLIIARIKVYWQFYRHFERIALVWVDASIREYLYEGRQIILRVKFAFANTYEFALANTAMLRTGEAEGEQREGDGAGAGGFGR